ncbi:hypothetical protein ABK040_007721 [Willaertia magna]
MKQIGLIPSGAQQWYKRTIALSNNRLIYCSTIAIYIYNIIDYRLERILTGHTLAITAIVVCPHSPNLVASSSLDQSIRIWDMNDGKIIKVIDTKQGNFGQFKPLCIDWSFVDQYQIVCAGKRGIIRIYDYSDESNTSISLGNDDVRMVGFNPRNPALLFATSGAEIFIIDSKKKKVLNKYKYSEYKVVDFQWDPLSNSYLLCSYENGQSVLYDVEAKDNDLFKVRQFEKSGAGISCVLWIRKEPGNFLTCDVRAGVVRFWNVSQSAPFKIQRVRQKSGFQDSYMLPDCQRAAFSFKDGAIGVYNMTKKQFDFITPGSHTETIFDCEFCPVNPDIFASSGYDHSIRLWDTHRIKVIDNLTSEGGVIYGLAWHPNKREVAGAFNNGSVIIWDALKRIPKMKAEIHRDCIFKIAWNQVDSTLLATASKDGYCHIFNEEGKIIRKLKHPSSVFGVHWHTSNRNIIATGCHDYIVRVFNISNSTDFPIAMLKGHTAEVFNVLWHPTIPNIIASGSNDKTVRVWNSDTGDCKILKGHTNFVRAVAWNHELPHILLSGGWDGTIRVWDVKNENQLNISNDHHADVYGLSSHPERPFIFVSTSRDTTIRFWDLIPLVQSLYIKAFFNQSFDGLLGEPQTPFSIANYELKLTGPGSKKISAKIFSLKTNVEKYTALAEFFHFPNITRNLWELANSCILGSKFKSSMKSDILFCDTITETVFSKSKELESARYKYKGQNATQKVQDQLKEAAKLYLRIGKFKNYCEIMFELGSYEKAISLAPAVSNEYWKELCSRYGKILSDSENEEAIPYYMVSGASEQALDFFINKNQLTDASILARRISENGFPLQTHVSLQNVENENPPITEDMKQIANLQARNYMRESKPTLAASAFLSVKEIGKCIHYLVKGNESTLAYGLFKSIQSNENPGDQLYISLARLCSSCKLWDIVGELLSNVKDKTEVTKLLKSLTIDDVDLGRLLIKSGLQSLSFYANQAPQVEIVNVPESIRYYALANDHVKAASLGASRLDILFSEPEWNWVEISQIHSAMQCIDALKLEKYHIKRVLFYINLIGCQEALWKEYFIIAPKLAQNAKECSKDISSETAIPRGYCEYLLCLSMAYVNNEEALNIINGILMSGTSHISETHLLAIKDVRRRLEDNSFSLETSTTFNIKAPTGSNLPSRCLDGKRMLSCVTQKEVQQPHILEDGESMISISELEMWREVNIFSPLLTGRKI